MGNGKCRNGLPKKHFESRRITNLSGQVGIQTHANHRLPEVDHESTVLRYNAALQYRSAVLYSGNALQTLHLQLCPDMAFLRTKSEENTKKMISKIHLSATTMIGLMSLCMSLNIASAQTSATKQKRYELSARASEIDPRVKSHPKINFLLETASGRPADVQNAIVDTSVPQRGKLVIWLMSHNRNLFDRLADYGLHAIQVQYARSWFSICCQDKPVGPHCRGNIRLEAATGQDFSDEVTIPKPDGMMERAYQFVKWLERSNPEGDWGQFFNADRSGLNWEKVIVSGSSHGSTTAARFAKYVKVSRVVALCGPRDQYQAWQALPSATPANRYFGFSHVLDGGWKADHYCRSWELLGMNQFGPIVNVDQTKPPYQNTRRLITDFDVGGNEKIAHSSVQPGSRAFKGKDGQFMHEPVWRYLYTHPVDIVGKPVPADNDCEKNQQQ